MRLLKLHPRIANRSCEVCQKFVFDEDTGKIEFGRNGTPEPRLLDAGPEFLAPCRDPRRGCPKGTPENSRELTDENRLCYDHYLECRAIGSFPDDSVVRRNASIIRDAEDAARTLQDAEYQRTILKMLE